VITAVIAAVVYGVRALESQLMTDDGLWLWRRDVEPQWSLPATTAASTATTHRSNSIESWFNPSIAHQHMRSSKYVSQTLSGAV
jgi:hypothetical protein